MLRRFLVAITVTAGLLLTACGGQPAAGALAAPGSAPRPATAAWLYGVSATSGTNAWAVGQADYPHGVTKLLIERWNGTKWMLVSIPNPAP